MDAVRFGLLAERGQAMLRRAHEVSAMTVDHRLPADALRQLIAAKRGAAEVVPLLEAILYPEDSDGE